MSKERKLNAWGKVRVERRQYEEIMHLLTLEEIDNLIKRAKDGDEEWNKETIEMLTQWKGTKEVQESLNNEDIPVVNEYGNGIDSEGNVLAPPPEPCTCPADCVWHGKVDKSEARQGRRVRTKEG